VLAVSVLLERPKLVKALLCVFQRVCKPTSGCWIRPIPYAISRRQGSDVYGGVRMRHVSIIVKRQRNDDDRRSPCLPVVLSFNGRAINLFVLRLAVLLRQQHVLHIRDRGLTISAHRQAIYKLCVDVP
jgi:hypothetical protein